MGTALLHAVQHPSDASSVTRPWLSWFRFLFVLSVPPIHCHRPIPCAAVVQWCWAHEKKKFRDVPGDSTHPVLWAGVLASRLTPKQKSFTCECAPHSEMDVTPPPRRRISFSDLRSPPPPPVSETVRWEFFTLDGTLTCQRSQLMLVL